ncbi:hypothetical protein TNCV_4299341 [Trichonephila clavipes]|nr:hypothetical protein TNCV_4299341 [Trichonephila clavipes]
MSTVECDATFHTSYHTLHNIIQQLLMQFIPFSVSALDEGVLVCRDSFDHQLASPKHPTNFQWGLHLENALAIRDVEYSHCLDNPEQPVFDNMLRCRPIKTNLSPTAPRKKTNMRK